MTSRFETNDGAGYILDRPFVPSFHPEMSPIWLTATLDALGIESPILHGSHYCELGCGTGFGLNALAAANPAMQFYGIDINPAHIDEARALAGEAGLGNVKFIIGDVRNFILEDAEIPQFDFIAAHGIYSWVPEDVRSALRVFVSQHLKTGGVAYLHYMSHPGAAPFATFHHLFRSLKGSGLEIEDGLSLLKNLDAGGAGFFVAHPAVKTTLQHMCNEPAAYLAHEYLNTTFQPMHAADVITSMTMQELTYVGSATPIENIDGLSIPGHILPLVSSQQDQALRETLKDIARNQALRRDLYMRSPRRFSIQEHLQRLRRRSFQALPGAPAAGGLKFETRIGSVDGPEEIFAPLLKRFSQGDASFEELEALPIFVDRPALLNQALHVLMGASVVHPIPEQTGDKAPAERFNAVLRKRRQNKISAPAAAMPEIASAVIWRE